MEKNIKDLFIDTQIEMLEAQLRAVKRLKGGDAAIKQLREGRSQMEYVKDVLKKAGHELHITEIIKLAAAQFHVNLDRESLVSALTKKVKRGDTFIRTDKNTFALKEEEEG